ncbi:glutamine amidotransferase [Burkholderia sp. 22PA0099]|uniref:glutamine amidotransferase n=1 Tax=Burkholderia sp. 22PA0099 TaxID=3237372 RepID=UPI0039C0E827
MKKPLLIVIAGETFASIRAAHDDFADWIEAGLVSDPEAGLPVERFDARSAEALPDPRGFAGIVVTGSHAMVTAREAWSERLGRWLAESAESADGPAMLGICYGHQLLGQALGGEVGDRRDGRFEIGTVSITKTADAAADPLFGALPARFDAQVVHYQSVHRLPAGARLLAASEADPCQAFRYGARTWGVQFHPEFPQAAIKAYLAILRAQPGEHGADAVPPNVSVRTTPVAFGLLGRFARLCAGR